MDFLLIVSFGYVFSPFLPLNGLFSSLSPFLSIATARLDDTLLPERAELEEVKSDRGKDHLDAHPLYRGHKNVRRVKNAVDHCVMPLARRSLFTDAAIPQRIPNADRMIPSTAFHRRGVAFRHCAVIASIAVHDLAFL